MKSADKVKRGPLFFLRGPGGLVTCHYGDPTKIGGESEHIFTVHESLVADLIAGLTAVKQSR